MAARPAILVPEAVLPNEGDITVCAGVAVRVEDGRIAELGNPDRLSSERPDAEIVDLASCLLMPGLVNAHQHGRGLTALQLGLRDDFLELVIAARSGRGPMDAEALVGLACAEMLRNGVTGTLQANVAFGGPDYEAELRAMIGAYDTAGLRATICIGAQDRGFDVYPDGEDAAFLEGLPASVRRRLTTKARRPYMGGPRETAALMDRLLADYAGNERITFLYGPAGPQWLSDSFFSHLVDAARGQGVGFHLHCLETRAQRAAADRFYPDGVVAHLDRLGVLTEGSSLAHCVYVTGEDIAIVAARGLAVAVNPGSNLRLRNGVAPAGDMIARGIALAVGTDNRALEEGEDILSELRLLSLLNRSTQWDGPPSLTPPQLLRIVTHNGARILGNGGAVGAVAPGQWADLIAIDLTHTRGRHLDAGVPLGEAVLARARGQDVTMTMVAGRILYRNGAVTSLNVDDLAARASASARTAGGPSDAADDETEILRRHIASHYRRLTSGGGRS